MTAPKESVAGRRGRVVRASDLAQMVVCEQAWLFGKTLGERRTEKQQMAIRRGQELHQDYFHEGLMLMAEFRSSWLLRLLRVLLSWLPLAWPAWRRSDSALRMFDRPDRERRGGYE